MEKSEKLRKLEKLKKDLQRKQKKLQKYENVIQARAHVKQTIEAHSSRTDSPCGSPHKQHHASKVRFSSSVEGGSQSNVEESPLKEDYSHLKKKPAIPNTGDLESNEEKSHFKSEKSTLYKEDISSETLMAMICKSSIFREKEILSNTNLLQTRTSEDDYKIQRVSTTKQCETARKSDEQYPKSSVIIEEKTTTDNIMLGRGEQNKSGQKVGNFADRHNRPRRKRDPSPIMTPIASAPVTFNRTAFTSPPMADTSFLAYSPDKPLRGNEMHSTSESILVSGYKDVAFIVPDSDSQAILPSHCTGAIESVGTHKSLNIVTKDKSASCPETVTHKKSNNICHLPLSENFEVDKASRKVSKKKSGKKSQRATLNVLDFSYLEEDEQDMYSQIKGRRRRSAQSRLSSELNSAGMPRVLAGFSQTFDLKSVGENFALKSEHKDNINQNSEEIFLSPEGHVNYQNDVSIRFKRKSSEEPKDEVLLLEPNNSIIFPSAPPQAYEFFDFALPSDEFPLSAMENQCTETTQVNATPAIRTQGTETTQDNTTQDSSLQSQSDSLSHVKKPRDSLRRTSSSRPKRKRGRRGKTSCDASTCESEYASSVPTQESGSSCRLKEKALMTHKISGKAVALDSGYYGDCAILAVATGSSLEVFSIHDWQRLYRTSIPKGENLNGVCCVALYKKDVFVVSKTILDIIHTKEFYDDIIDLDSEVTYTLHDVCIRGVMLRAGDTQEMNVQTIKIQSEDMVLLTSAMNCVYVTHSYDTGSSIYGHYVQECILEHGSCIEIPTRVHSVCTVYGEPDALIAVSTCDVFICDGAAGVVLSHIELSLSTHLCTSVTVEQGLLFFVLWHKIESGWSLLALNPLTERTCVVLTSQPSNHGSITASRRYGNTLIGLHENGKLSACRIHDAQLIADASCASCLNTQLKASCQNRDSQPEEINCTHTGNNVTCFAIIDRNSLITASENKVTLFRCLMT